MSSSSLLLQKKTRREWLAAQRSASIGIELVVSLLIGIAVGRLADRFLGSAPYGLWLGLTLGLTAGFRSLYLLAKAGSSTGTQKGSKDPKTAFDGSAS